MSGAALDPLFVATGSRVHNLPPQLKLLGAGLFIAVVIATPHEAHWAFAWYTALLLVVVRAARLPLGLVGRRMVIEVPFLVFALLLPFVGRPPTVELLGMTLSQPGLTAAWTIAVKASLGVAMSVVLAATSRSAELVDGLARLRLPAVMVEIASFMVRYTQVVADQWRRMEQARAARGFEGSGPSSWLVLARSVGVLFIRSYERGERVHLAMLSRGYQGSLPQLEPEVPGGAAWAAALALPLAAAAGLAFALVAR